LYLPMYVLGNETAADEVKEISTDLGWRQRDVIVTSWITSTTCKLIACYLAKKWMFFHLFVIEGQKNRSLSSSRRPKVLLSRVSGLQLRNLKKARLFQRSTQKTFAVMKGPRILKGRFQDTLLKL
jgi:hypothetical protein